MMRMILKHFSQCWHQKKCKELLIHTRVFGAGLFGGFAGLSCSDAVDRQDSELVVHPGAQVSDSG